MIISPPQLRDHSPGEHDSDWVQRMMPADPERNYPISMGHSWHGGIHINNLFSEPVRCSADGIVVSLRQPDVQNRFTQPLNYKGETDNGYILLKHETNIGNGDNGKITYYSLYMHLSSIDSNVQAGKTMYRKNPVGISGMADGKNTLHFQIFCDDENILKITGRTHPELDLTRNGRTDAVYGDTHFYLPAGTKVYGSMPENNSPTNNNLLMTIAVPLFITMHFDKGNCTMTTRQQNPTLPDSYIQVGAELTNTDGEDYEYNLFVTAQKLYPRCPSAGYELLRFGRVINTDHEILSPSNAPLWRSVNTPEGAGIVNLAANDIKVYSDADFPHWIGWQLIDDDTDTNSQCNSPTILCSTDRTLSRMICHFPLEWDRSSVDSRFEWLKSPNDVTSQPMQECDLKLLTDHGKALCLEENPLPSGRVWHFEPREFISHFRRCGWLSKSELKQIVPNYALSGHNWQEITYDDSAGSTTDRIYTNLNGTMQKYLITSPSRIACFLGNAVQETAWLSTTHESYRYAERDSHTGRIIRHYNIWYYPWHGRGILQTTNPTNYFNYFKFRGHSYSEKMKNRLSIEYVRLYRNRTLRYTDNHLSDEESTVPHDDTALSTTVIDWRNIIDTGSYEPTDSAGFYWCHSKMARHSDAAHIIERSTARTSNGIKVYYRSMAFWNASAAVNLPTRVATPGYSGLNGFDARCCVYGSAIYVLMENKFPDKNNALTLEQPESDQLRRLILK